MEVRDKRTTLRELHQRAKIRFTEIYGVKLKNCDRHYMQKFKSLKREMQKNQQQTPHQECEEDAEASMSEAK